MKPEELIHRYLLGEASQAEVEQLDGLLAEDPALRRKFVEEVGVDTGLREIALERLTESATPTQKIISPIFRPLAFVAAAAAVLMFSVIVGSIISRPDVIATLISAEDAAWESSLPTAPGSELTAGYLKLTAGIAIIRFRSGAEVTIEAPAKLVLKTPMRGLLVSGAAVVDVPEPAIGFILETPDGYAVDHGTKFAVRVGDPKKKKQSKFEVLEGEITVHLPSTGEQVRLTDKQGASVSAAGIDRFEGPLPEVAPAKKPGMVRVYTKRRAASIIRNNDQSYLHPEYLMVKKTDHSEGFERRAIFSFDLSGVDFEALSSARIRLNQVPSGVGLAAHLPKMNRFVIHGLRGELDADWENEITWEDVPDPDDEKYVGTFVIPRSQQRGVFGIETQALYDFLKAHAGKQVTFILSRKTGERDGRGLVHTFSSASNPEAAGPVLELSPEKINELDL